MHANSPLIESSQSVPHPRLLDVLEKHRRHRYRRPFAAHSVAALEQMRQWLRHQSGAELFLDSGCGTGASTAQLASNHAQSAVVGIDQSASRLARGVALPTNALCLRAPLEDLWRMLLDQHMRPQRHGLWYPNPWPKPEHLMRRWHGHPLFPHLLALGGQLELRSNWRVYVDEFALALEVCGHHGTIDEIAATETPVSPFERKYRDSGHRLWRLRVDLG